MFRGAFLEKPVFHIRPFEVSFPFGMLGNCFICVLTTVSYNLEISNLGFWNIQTSARSDLAGPVGTVRSRRTLWYREARRTIGYLEVSQDELVP